MNDDLTWRRVLIVKLADLGDLLLSEPAMRSLRTAMPDASIDVLVPPTSAALVPLLGHEIRVLKFPKALYDNLQDIMYPRRAGAAIDLALRLHRRSYDVVVLLHHLTTSAGTLKFRALVAATGAPVVVGLDNGRGTFLTRRVTDLGFGVRHEVEYMLAVAQLAGGAEVDPCPRIAPLSLPETFQLPERCVVIAPVSGAYSSARNWAIERYVSLATRITAHGSQVVIVGAADALPAANAILRAVPTAVDLTGKTSLAELAVVVSRASVVVGNDSFIPHLAAALDRPVVTIFGPSNSSAWRPYQAVDLLSAAKTSRCAVVHADLPCAPCLYTGFRLGRRAGCPTRTCLDLVAVDQVEQAVRQVVGDVVA